MSKVTSTLRYSLGITDVMIKETNFISDIHFDSNDTSQRITYQYLFITFTKEDS